MHVYVGAITGFTDLGDINNHLISLEKNIEDHAISSIPLANSMLVLLVKGLFSNLSFPYAQFSCTSICGDQMYDIFWEAVGRLELMGFKVMALTYDGLSANRRLFRLHNPTATPDDIVYKTLNPYADDGRYVYFFADPPHLMKTVGNGWASK